MPPLTMKPTTLASSNRCQLHWSAYKATSVAMSGIRQNSTHHVEPWPVNGMPCGIPLSTICVRFSILLLSAKSSCNNHNERPINTTENQSSMAASSMRASEKLLPQLYHKLNLSQREKRP